MKLIQSRDNPSFKQLLKLSSTSKQRKKSQQTLLDGAHLVKAYLDTGHTPVQILLNQGALRDQEIAQQLKRVPQVPIIQLDDGLFNELSELKTSTGILALIDIMQPKQQAPQFALLLENIQDPGNLGSIIRSAAAAGCDSLYLSSGCADAWSPKVLRAAMGGHFVLSIFEQYDLPLFAKEFSGTLLATSLQAQQHLYNCELSEPLAFMMGNEGSGLSAELLNLATHKILIPMPGKVESLNVAAATAVCLFEVVRRSVTSR